MNSSRPLPPSPAPSTQAEGLPPGPTLSAGEQRLLRLAAGSELRCLGGQLLIEHPLSGPRLLRTGEGWRCPATDWTRLSAGHQGAARLHLSTLPESGPGSGLGPEKSRSGLTGWERLWMAWTAPWAR